MIIIISIATFLSTLAGGLIALRFKDKLHLILGFSAGAVLGVVFFDLIPESISLGSKFYDVSMMTVVMAIGFFVYLILDRVVLLHTHGNDDHLLGNENSHGHENNDEHNHGHSHEHDGTWHTHYEDLEEHNSHGIAYPSANGEGKASRRGILGASSLSVHSFFDGMAIGLAFQVSTAIGAIVAVAVLVHDFSDGINTVNLILKNKGEGKQAFRWLLVDALAPVLGAASTLLFKLPEQGLSIVLALFSGFFLYIGASDLIPESHHAHSKFLTTVMTLLGATVLFIAIRVSGM